MTDILDHVVRMPAPGLRLSDEAGVATAAFVRAIVHDRDRDTAVGIAAALVMILIQKEANADASRILSHMNRVSRNVHAEWSRYA